MCSKRIIKDDDFGIIVVRSRMNARNVSMRVKKDGLYVTVPPRFRSDRLMSVLEEYRPKLLESYRKVSAKLIDDSFTIDAPCFKLSVLKGNVKLFSVRRKEEGIMQIICPENTDFTSENVQKLLRAAIIRAMKKGAEEFLPPLLSFWAGKYGLEYKKVRISGARTKWGSCTSGGTISLSCYLILLPVHLMDYVILHELAHTKEMNHGPKFWELLDSMTDGNALRLRKEIRTFRPDFQ